MKKVVFAFGIGLVFGSVLVYGNLTGQAYSTIDLVSGTVDFVKDLGESDKNWVLPETGKQDKAYRP